MYKSMDHYYIIALLISFMCLSKRYSMDDIWLRGCFPIYRYPTYHYGRFCAFLERIMVLMISNKNLVYYS